MKANQKEATASCTSAVEQQEQSTPLLAVLQCSVCSSRHKQMQGSAQLLGLS